MNAKQRLDRQQRKAQIIEAVLPLFSEKGINSVTSRDMAKAAGVSEGLIYKHFPNKRELYESVFDHICAEMTAQLESLKAIPPSFDSLMFFMSKFIDHVFSESDLFDRFLPKVIMRSIIEDGEFASYFLRNID